MDITKSYAILAAALTFVILMRQKNNEGRKSGYLRRSGDTISHISPNYSTAQSEIKLIDLSEVEVERSLGGILFFYGTIRLQSDAKDFYPIKYVLFPTRIRRHLGKVKIKEVHSWQDVLTVDNIMKVFRRAATFGRH